MASFKSSREYSVNSADLEISSVIATEKEYNLKFLICLCLTVTISSFVMGIYYLGYEIGVLNISEIHIRHYYGWKGQNKSRFIALANVLLCFGGIIGAYASGRVSNWLGRRKTLIRTNLLYFAAIGIVVFI
jgi:Na+/melibiose symporter-like transporter